jgi:hypothetical protein
VSNLPAQNHGFVGREDALGRMRELLTTGGRVVTRAKARMGGVGKTQLAVEYGHRFADEYDVVWLIPAEQGELIGTFLAQAALAAGLIGPDAATSAAVEATHRAMRGDQRWLLIFDNAEAPQALETWLPARGGHVIITSRTLGWDELAAPVDVGFFERSESTTLLRRRIDSLREEDADRLADRLGDLPLAVASAATFMSDTGMPVDEYLRLLGTHTSQLLDSGHSARYSTPLAASINLAADRLTAHSEAAAQLLNLCAVLGPEPIPTSLFTTAATTLPPPLRDAAGNAIEFYQLVKAIGDHGLATTGNQGVQLHRLIQAILRNRMDDAQLDVLPAQAAALLVEATPRDADSPDAWPTWATLAPHIIAADPATTGNRDLRTVGTTLVLYLLRRAETRAALQLADHLRTSWHERFGPDNVHTLQAITEYAHARHALGEIHEAHPIIEDTLTRRRRLLGDEHPDTLRSAQDFAVSLQALGDYAAARDLDRDTLSRRRVLLGDDHRDTLHSAQNLALNLQNLGDDAAARDLNQDTLGRRRRLLGDDHPDTLRSAGALAYNLHALGEVTAARDLHRDTLNRRRRILGDDHPDTLDSTHGLATALFSTGNSFAARTAMEDVCSRARSVLGPDHPRTRLFTEDRIAMIRAMGGSVPAQRKKPKKGRKK